MPMNERELQARDAKRDIGAELLEAVRWAVAKERVDVGGQAAAASCSASSTGLAGAGRPYQAATKHPNSHE